MYFKYGMKRRPFDIGCQPHGANEVLEDKTGKYFNILVYDHPLTFDEIERYELAYIESSVS